MTAPNALFERSAHFLLLKVAWHSEQRVSSIGDCGICQNGIAIFLRIDMRRSGQPPQIRQPVDVAKVANERKFDMSRLKMIAVVAILTLVSVNSASANWRHPHRFYYGYGPVYAPPVLVPPPPVVVAPAPVVASPVYTTSAVVAPVPAPMMPVYAPAPVYSYGFVGPRRFGYGYASPGFSFYYGR